jgi:hypothetical protein
MSESTRPTDTGLPLGRSFWAIQPDALPRSSPPTAAAASLEELAAARRARRAHARADHLRRRLRRRDPADGA